MVTEKSSTDTGTPMMACGHAANAKRTASKGVKHDPPLPCCAICDCAEIAAIQPDLSGRIARCSYYGRKCKSEQPSVPGKLAFFEHRPAKDFDVFYCGCFGWD